MKKTLTLIALISSITFGLSASLISFTAAAHGPTPLKVEKSIIIKADPAKVWALVKDFGNMQKWHPAVVSTKSEKKGEETFRTLSLKGGGEIYEKLRTIDDTAMKMKYEIVTSPLPLTDYYASMTVSKGANPGETEVKWAARFYRFYKLNPPIPAGQDDESALNAINGIFDAGLAGLKKVAESSN